MLERELERAREDTNGFKVYVLATYYFVTGNYSLIVVLTGLGMIAYGATILSGRPQILFDVVAMVPDQLQVLTFMISEHGVFAGMFGVWGASLVVIGVSAYAFLWANQLYARLTTDTEEEEETEAEPDLETNTL